MRTVLYLDVDGVLNCLSSPGWAETNMCLDPEKIERLNRILQAGEITVILSSMWRFYDDACEALNAVGITWSDMTDKSSRWNRDKEIRIDIESRGVINYVILDDSCDPTIWGRNLINCTWEEGLTEELTTKAIELIKSYA